VPCCSSKGVSHRIFSMQGGDLKKKFYKGVSQNRPTLQGGINYLTLKVKISLEFDLLQIDRIPPLAPSDGR
jgi:hypothetical protein